MVPVGTDLPLPSSELAQLFSVESEQLAALHGPGGEVEEGGNEPHHPHPRGPQIQPQETEALAHPHLQGDTNHGSFFPWAQDTHYFGKQVLDLKLNWDFRVIFMLNLDKYQVCYLIKYLLQI